MGTSLSKHGHFSDRCFPDFQHACARRKGGTKFFLCGWVFYQVIYLVGKKILVSYFTYSKKMYSVIYLVEIYYYTPLPLNLANKQQASKHFSFPFWPLLGLIAPGSTLL